ncbi:SdiA-regulated domain-containing protein [Paraglaciecola sp.]|uniref:SdiA-regulated domain-containing protein n=1 Tax=Paraglaciecola sp. TaxID=1920173 RepID=UPI00273DA1B1|nr:SdiA-regulated domain-containing protein [Paraglaciecola sp.]MDP5032063.1 SdiA-regulated domain-containing protein [Paraglaciecola sp.]
MENKRIMMKAIFIASFMLLTACGSIASDKLGYTVETEFNLPGDLAETSGLYCPASDTIFTINDSGNSPTIYQLNTSGEIVKRQDLDKKNQDWEAITGDNDNFYVGDIGNNNGKRAFVEILVINKQNQVPAITKVLKLSYANNNIENNEYLKHDFDAEALVSADDALLLFSKSWQSTVSHVYKIEPSLAEQVVSPIASIDGLPGVVTGIDFNKSSKQFTVVGYSVSGFGKFSPFIALLDRRFNVVATYPLDGFNQVEGVCVSPTGEVWISQESSFFSTHKLAKLKFR